MRPDENPEQRLILYTPLPELDTQRRFAALLEDVRRGERSSRDGAISLDGAGGRAAGAPVLASPSR
jgi:hypothetical protein